MADESGTKAVVSVSCCLLLLVISCSLLGTSFDVLKPTEVGIYYNPTRHRADFTKIWKNGRHCLAPGHHFMKFKTKLKLFDELKGDGIACWTKDKQEVQLQLAVFYQLIPEKVIEIYKRYGWSSKEIYEYKILESVRGATKFWDTIDYFQHREVVANNISKAVIAGLADEHVKNVSVVMGNVNIPYEFEMAVTSKVVEQQRQVTVFNQRNLTMVLAETELIMARAGMESSILLAEARANADSTTAIAGSTAEEVEERAYAEAYAYVKSTLGLDHQQLMRYIWQSLFKTQSARTEMVVGFDSDLGIKTTTD